MLVLMVNQYRASFKLYRFTGEKFVFTDTGKIKAQVLPERYRKLFLNKQIVRSISLEFPFSANNHQVCMEYQDITSDNEREIFQVRNILGSSYNH